MNGKKDTIAWVSLGLSIFALVATFTGHPCLFGNATSKGTDTKEHDSYQQIVAELEDMFTEAGLRYPTKPKTLREAIEPIFDNLGNEK